MRDVTSALYVSPSPSMMSRDPDGIDSDELEKVPRLEPSGFRSEAIAAVKAARRQRKLDHLKNIDLAKLVGVPPPPPKTPPPKKIRRERTETTPKAAGAGLPSHESDEFEFPLDNNSAASPTTHADTSSNENPGELSVDMTPVNVAAQEDKAHSVVPVDDDQFDNSIPPPPPPTVPRNVKTSLSIAEQRRQAALANYQDKDLVLDHEETLLAEELLRSAMTTLEDKPQIVPEHRPAMTTLENKPQLVSERTSKRVSYDTSPQKYPSSPSSEVTKPHSNQSRIPPEQRIQSRSVQYDVNESATHDAPDISNSNVEEENNAESKPERRRRGVSLEKKQKPKPESKSETMKEEKEKRDKKRGFFKKLFRGRGKERSSSQERSNSKQSDPPIVEEPKAQEPLADQNESEVKPEQFIIRTEPMPSVQQPALKPVLKSVSERQYQGNPLATVVHQPPSQNLAPQPAVASPLLSAVTSMPKPGISTVDTPQIADENLPMASKSPSDGSPKTQRAFSQDPPDDEHGDPPVFSGPPLISPRIVNPQLIVTTTQEEEQDRIESVRSRIAGLYEEHVHAENDGHDDHEHITGVPSSLSNDRPDFFFHNDEVSALTGPCPSFESLQKKSKSFDPSSITDSVDSDPQGDFNVARLSTKAQDGGPVLALGSKMIDPYSVPASHIRDHGPLPTPAHLSNLRVQVHARSVDPAGASPLQESTRGGQVSHTFGDPVGESPVEWKKVNMSTNDPVGESPYHAAGSKKSISEFDDSNRSDSKVDSPQAEEIPEEEFPDPELTAGYFSDDSSCADAEEKKELTEPEEKDVSMAKFTSDVPAEQIDGTEGPKDYVEQVDEIETPKDNDVEQDPAQVDSTLLPQKKVVLQSSHGKLHESIVESSVDSKSTPAKQEQAPKESSAMSKATRAALKLAKTTGTDAIKAQLYASPTPTNQDLSNDRVGSTPVFSPSVANTLNKVNMESKSLSATMEKAALPGQKRADESKNLKVDTTMEKSGFRSGSNTPASTNKALTVTAAAFTNAKAVAYLHRLHGEPSPRHSWHVSKKKQAEPSPVANINVKPKDKTRKEKATKPSTSSQNKAPSPEEYGAHNLLRIEISEDPGKSQGLHSSPEDITPKRSHLVRTKPPSPEVLFRREKKGPEKMFSAYRSKFQGRKPSKKNAPVPETALEKHVEESGTTTSTTGAQEVLKKPTQLVIRPGKITGLAVAKGLKLRRNKRKNDIESGRSTPVVLTPRQKPTGRNRFTFFPANESEIKDPIQRAGRRLLSKAAIPIQKAARSYIAKREAIDRMWALIEIQSYCRRWRCEANLQASIHSATVVQTAFRGWLAIQKVKDMHYGATQIQKIMRGYLAAAHVYDTIYYVVRIQALLRGCYNRKMNVKKEEGARLVQRCFRGHLARSIISGSRSVVPFQALYRGHKAREELSVTRASVTLIQSAWRSYSARISFQFQIVDIIIVQSIARRWVACRQSKNLQNLQHFSALSKVQARWRGCAARTLYRTLYKKNLAARKIQASWRGFQCYTDYIFALVDILVAQRTVRRWLAIREANALRQEETRKAYALQQEKAAIILQSQWRCHKAQLTLLYSMVNVIVAQSVARRFLSRFAVQARKKEIEAAHSEDERKHAAATSIQKTWRGFWGFSHFIIVQYEITHLQAIIRGKLARQSYNLQLGCVIIIQASARQYLAKKAVNSKVVSDTLVASAALELRERNASKRIQFWWRIVLDWIHEKKAALTIERFFIHVREEVDREIIRCEKRKSSKEEKRRKKRRESEGKLLLKTVDERNAVADPSDTQSEKGSRSKSAPRLRGKNSNISAPGGIDMPLDHRMPPSPRTRSANQGMRHETDDQGWHLQRLDSESSGMPLPTDAVRLAPSEDVSEMSNITNPSAFHSMGNPSSRQMKQMKPARTDRTEVTDELSLEEGYHHDVGARRSEEKRMSTEDYIKKYGGLKTAPNRLSSSAGQNPKHFFSEDGGANQRKMHRVPSNGTPTTFSQSQTQATTPRSDRGTKSRRKSSNGTPRSHSQSHGQASPRSHSPSHTQASTIFSSVGPTTPRGHGSHNPPSPRMPPGNQRGDRHLSYPPVTPTRQKAHHSGRGERHHGISRRETSETESQTTMSQTTFSKPSPRARPDGHRVPSPRARPDGHRVPSPRAHPDGHRVHGSSVPVMVMKTYPNFSQSHSVDEAQEVLYLGEEYGEV